MAAAAEQVTRLQLYSGNADGHPDRNEYRIIAETVGRYLRHWTPETAGRGHLVPIDDTVSGLAVSQ